VRRVMRHGRFRQAPPWWPEGEPWPPPHRARWRHGRRRFLARIAILFVVILSLSAYGALTLVRDLAGSSSGQILTTGAVIWAAVLLIAIGFGLTMRLLGRPMSEVVAAADRVGAGDFAARIPEHGPSSLRSVASAFNSMMAQLEQQQRIRRALMADIAHELRTPLSVMQGRLEGMIDGVYPRDERQMGQVLEDTRTLARLVEDLRTLAHSESGTLALAKEPTDLTALLAETAAAFQPEARARGVEIKTTVAEDMPAIDVDPVRIREVVMNLLANAVRHAPPQSVVRLDAETIETGIRVWVTDRGDGIRPEDLPHVFDRFHKGPGSSGSGLGLTIARSLVGAHNGMIAARVPAEGGTIVEFTIPKLMTRD
jgi:two-component system, OmpR family, sensor histidine kinase BaeS